MPYTWVALFNGMNDEEWPYYIYPGSCATAIVADNHLTGVVNTNTESFFCAALGSSNTVVRCFDNEVPDGFTNVLGGNVETSETAGLARSPNSDTTSLAGAESASQPDEPEGEPVP